MTRWTPEIVGDWIVEAVETAKLLPGVRPAGYRTFWPDVIRKRFEVHGLLEKHNDEPTRCYAGGEAIDRFDQVQEWLSWLRIEERRMLIAWARGIPDRKIGRRAGHDHKYVQRHRARSLTVIARKLNSAFCS